MTEGVCVCVSYLAARASCCGVKLKGDSSVTSFLGSSRLKILEMLNDLCDAGEEVLVELSPLSEPLAMFGLLPPPTPRPPPPPTSSSSSGVPGAWCREPPMPGTGERRGRGEGDLLLFIPCRLVGLPLVITLVTSKDIIWS